MNALELRRLAGRYGVQSSYLTTDGRRVSASRESLIAILRSLGAPVDGAGAVLDEGDAKTGGLSIEPVCVAWEGEPASIAVLAEPRSRDARVTLQLTTESGEQREWAGELDAVSDSARGDGGWAAYRVALPALPRGYHRLTVRHDGRSYETMLIAAPRRCYGGDQTRAWGMFAPAYALRDTATLGVGSVRELREFARGLASRGGSLLGTLPLLATDMALDPSPYRPLSRLFWNEHYADISQLPIDEALRDELGALAQTPIIDHGQIACLKRRVLAAAAAGDLPPPDERLLDYARFRAASERHGVAWREWPDGMRNGAIAAGDVDAAVVRYHGFAQRLIAEQMERATREMRDDGVELYLDVPLGVHPDGYDAWRYRSLFLDGCSAGAPPDGFFSLGQNWAFAPQHREELRRSGYAYTVDVLRQHMGNAGLVRIDHVMGLHRLYVIPDGFAARDGAYLQYHADEMYAILALESHRNRCAVVGENLGTVPGYINRAMKAHGLHGMYVAEFAADPERDGRLPAPEAHTIAGMDTHDTATFAAFWEGKDIDDRLARGLLHEQDEAGERAGRAEMRERVARALDLECGSASADAALGAWMRFIAQSSARYVIVNTEDLWLETEPQNRPGTSDDYPNWRRRFARSIEEMRDDTSIARPLDTVAEARDATNERVERKRVT